MKFFILLGLLFSITTSYAKTTVERPNYFDKDRPSFESQRVFFEGCVESAIKQGIDKKLSSGSLRAYCYCMTDASVVLKEVGINEAKKCLVEAQKNPRP